MRTVEYLSKQYVVEGSVGAPDDAIFLDTLPADKLVELRNILTSALDLGRSIKMFQSKAKGIAAVAGLLAKWEAFEPEDEVPAETEPEFNDDLPDEMQPAAEAETEPAPTGPTISAADLLRHDFEEEDVEIVNKEWPDGIPATEASVKRAFDLGMDGGVFRKAIDAATVSTGKVRDGTKQAALIDLLKRPEGASIKEIVAALNWLPHTTRGAISRDVKKKLGMAVTKSKIEGRGQVYRITQ